MQLSDSKSEDIPKEQSSAHRGNGLTDFRLLCLLLVSNKLINSTECIHLFVFYLKERVIDNRFHCLRPILRERL